MQIEPKLKKDAILFCMPHLYMSLTNNVSLLILFFLFFLFAYALWSQWSLKARLPYSSMESSHYSIFLECTGQRENKRSAWDADGVFLPFSVVCLLSSMLSNFINLAAFAQLIFLHVENGQQKFMINYLEFLSWVKGLKLIIETDF